MAYQRKRPAPDPCPVETVLKIVSGKWKVRVLHLPSLDELSFELTVNGELRQAGKTADMIFDVPAQLRFLNSLVPLLKGDLIFTGTPEGVNTLRKGDKFEMQFTSGPRALRLPSKVSGVL